MPDRRPLIDLDAHLPPNLLFLAGLVSLPAFLLTESLAVKFVLGAAYVLLALLAGMRIRVFTSLTVGIGIVAANLVVPSGKLLADPFGLLLTEGALVSGAIRAATIIGLIYFSRLTVRPRLRLPGRFGGLLGLMFFYFERITARRAGFDWKKPWLSLDLLLAQAYKPDGGPDETAPLRVPTIPGAAALAVFTAGHWLAFMLGLKSQP
jgi:hypothetical protein